MEMGLLDTLPMVSLGIREPEQPLLQEITASIVVVSSASEENNPKR